jgi:hypothetical protein
LIARLLGRRQIADSPTMADGKKRMYLKLPVELAEQIEVHAGQRGRDAFIAAVLELEIRRRRIAAQKSQEIQAREISERLWIN